MKKSFSVFTLVMLLAVQILTPVTYAVGDEEFVEESIVQEETPEEVEEVSDDVDDETDDADLDEEEDEDSLTEEDDSFSGDVVDEDSLEMSGDIIPDAESESGDVVVIDSESGAVAATGSEVVVESSVDVSGTSSAAGSSESSVTVDDEFITKLSKQGSVAKIAEELGINWYTDSSEWAIKAGIEGKYLGTKEQNNIIREYFIQHAREILGAQESNEVVNEEVVEESEVVVELNKEEISGRKYYNGVTAIVLAPINTFPEGTTLSIVPIKAKKDLNEIKEQLVEQQDEVTEESNVVAFDISFLYSGEEVQPVSGQTVQVTFNYGNHEKLSEANENEEQELKVYHLNDKDGSGNKVEDISEVKVEEVEIVKNEEGELVVDAESFSVYTIVTQVAEGPKALEDQLANFKYGMISIARPDSLSGKYSDTLGFTIMDRNLGAEKTGAFIDLTATGSYGYHYQWGNNYGFISYTGLTDEYKTGNKIDVSGKNEYSGNQFVWGSSNNTWMSGSNNDNLWTGDNKQGPCPEGWHVPTAKEWSQLLEFYVYKNNPNNTDSLTGSDGYNLISNGDVASGFAYYFQIPFAAFRNYVDADVKNQGGFALLWSSSPNGENARGLFLNSSDVSANFSGFRAYGYSVRCFKNSYEGTGAFNLITFNYDGGTGSTAQIQVASGSTGAVPSNPIKLGYVFDGWYTDDETFENKYEFNVPVTSSLSLYAKWEPLPCEFATENFNEGVKITGFSGDSQYYESCLNNLVIPDEIDGKKVLRIENSCFNNKGISGELKLPKDLLEIGNGTFQNNKISKVYFGESIKKIDVNAFSENLIEGQLILPETLNSLGHSAFRNNKITGEIRIPNGVASIGEYTFAGNKGITSLILGDNTTSIGQHAFDSLYNNLGKVDLKNVKEIGSLSFGGNNFSSIYIPDSVERIDDRAFAGGNNNRYTTGYFTKDYAAVNIHSNSFLNPIRLYKYTFVNEEGTLLATGYYQSGVISDMKKVIPIGYYTEGIEPTVLVSSLIPYTSPNVVEWEGLPSDSVATEDRVITGHFIKNYNITFHYDNGSENYVQVVREGLTGTYRDVPVGEGYKFLGWFEEGGDKAFDFVNTPITGNIDLYQRIDCALGYEWNNEHTSCSLVNYTIRYEGADGLTEGFESSYNVTTPTIELKTPAKSGWNFIAWHDGSLDGNIVTEISEGSVGNKTFYAEWTGKVFTVNYDENGATGIGKTSDRCQVSEGSTCTVVAPTITRENFDILGWNIDGTAHVADVKVGSGIELSEITESNTISYNAITKKDIKVEFDANGNGGTYEDGQCTIWNSAVKCSVVSPQNITYPSNYTVIGWSDDSSLHENQWTGGTSKDFTENGKYYAQTMRDIYATFKANGNTLLGDNGEDVTTEIQRHCTKYNSDADCPIVVPAIKENPNTKTILGYTVATNTGSAIAVIGDERLDGASIQNNNLEVRISGNATEVYAQTRADQKIYNVEYRKGTGISIIADIRENSCTIPATYNGVLQDNSCSVTAPGLATFQNYDTGNWGYRDTDGSMILPGDEITITSDGQVVTAYAQDIHYAINYILGDGEWSVGTVVTGSYQEGDSFELPVPVRDDYTFIGWKDGLGNSVTGITATDKGTKTFTANWRQNTYRIYYSNQGYDANELPLTHTYGEETTVPTLTNERLGYVFSGWIGSNGAVPQKVVTISADVSGELQYTAVWDLINYTIEYDLKGGSLEGNVNPDSFTITTPTFSLYNPTRANSTFNGWIVNNGTTPVGDIVIYKGSVENRSYAAQFTCNEGYIESDNGESCVAVNYDIDYVLGDGAFDSSTTVQEDVAVEDGVYQIGVVNPIRTGFNFVGWSVNLNRYSCIDGNMITSTCKSSGTNPLIIEFSKGQDVTLTALWERVPVEVRLGDVINGVLAPDTSVSVATFDYNRSVVLNASTMVGYTTSGWTTTLTGNKEYEDKMPVNISTLDADGKIVYDAPSRVSGGIGRISLYAIREPIEYKIIYDLDGGENDLDNPETRLITDTTFNLKNASKVGYTFVSWVNIRNGMIINELNKEILGTLEVPYELHLRAIWTPRTDTAYTVYHVKQDLNGEYHTGNEQLTNTLNLQGTTGSPVTPEVESYVGFTSPQQTTKDIAPDGTMYIIYQYPRDKYDYTFVEGVTGAKTDGTTSSAITFFEAPIVLSGEINTGYSWSGWNIQSGDETLFVADKHYEFTMPLNNVTVTPVVEHNKWSVEFDVNEGTGDVVLSGNEYPMYYDDEITYPVVTRLGYTFTGWYDDVNNVRYDGTDKKMPNADLTLTAHWQANDYTLSVEHYLMNLDGENYTEDVASKVVIATKTDATVTEGVSAKDFTGFTLSGVSLESVHMNPVEGDAMTIKYYYSRDKHNVTVNENEGVTLSGTKSGEYYYGSTINVEGKVKEGYTWSGWNVSTGSEEPIFTTDTGAIKVLGTGDLVFTPLATINSYHLTVKNDGAIIFSGDVVYKTNVAQYLAQPTKNGYTFNGWTNRPTNDLMPAKDLVVEAKWTYKSNGGGGGGGGGSSYSSSSEKKTFYNTTGANEKTHGSAELTGDNKNADSTSKEETTVENEKSIKDMNFEELKDVKADQLNKVDRTKLTKEENEILDAYQWAYEHNVTTMVSLRDANPEGIVTRGHLAKMVVNYATNVLGQQIPEKIPSECRWSDGKKDWESDEIKDYAVKACALGLMGLDMKKFSPNLRVTRAQFGTIMSRLLWGKKYAGGTPYYRKHLNALKLYNIMTQIQNPEGRVELRQWVWLMLMRAGEEK